MVSRKIAEFWKGAPYRELLRVSAHCSVILLDKVPCNLVFRNIFRARRLWSSGSGNIGVVIDQGLLVAVCVNASVRTVDGNGSSVSCHIGFEERW